MIQWVEKFCFPCTWTLPTLVMMLPVYFYMTGVCNLLLFKKKKKGNPFHRFFNFMMCCYLLRVTKQIALGERQSTLTVHNVFLFFRPFFTLI